MFKGPGLSRLRFEMSVIDRGLREVTSQELVRMAVPGPQTALAAQIPNPLVGIKSFKISVGRTDRERVEGKE